ncbi:unnamed protein product [Penicillium salamii]|uniref:Nucleoporin NUP188 n=1 Tax=Penicillium salamii TaxID=1612424 RepID=A0A9W4JW39_9EURO|nr:unnamed protein product [Penicillium salamii]CAG8099108.1 unnamed protein product [Penicillium salamii]CAG8100331.1 unnamed protein product [Penicillium salamii]CAG8104592.1 unnamed protein product [Penicillium salamii]CAG8171728.1 unnamed protein product [Penicillium salamii]
MAPVPEAYFPSLDKCFSGDVQLLSWKRAFIYTLDQKDHPDNEGNIDAFLSHPESIRILSDSLKPFPPPSAKSKSDFESKTAAIHVETNGKNSFDLKEIKADALWVSQQAGIDEVAALRIAVLEWQNRPATRLASGFSTEETTSLQSAAGAENFRGSLAGPSLASILTQTARSEVTKSFDTEESRRLRLREVYLSEASHVVKTLRKLLALSQHDGPAVSSVSSASNERKVALKKLGTALFKNKSNGAELERFLQDCIDSIRSRLTCLEGNGGWLSASESSEDLETTWRTALVEEVVHVMQLIFHQVQSSREIPTSTILSSWLQLMSDYSFMETIQVHCQQPTEVLLPLQALASLITLAILKLPHVISSIKDGTHTNFANKPYFLCKDKISKITEIFTTLGGEITTATPAAFSWGLVLYTMQQLADSARHGREERQRISAERSFNTNTENTDLSFVSEQTIYEEILDCAQTPQDTAESAITILTSEVFKDSAFRTVSVLASKAGYMSAVDDALTSRWIRLSLLDLVRVSTLFLDYSPEILEAVLTILGDSDNHSSNDLDFLGPESDPKISFAQDRDLMDTIFHVARSRFPYETSPFLQLCRALVSPHSLTGDGLPSIIEELENMQSFTQIVSPHFQGYDTIREDENADYVALLQPLPMFEASSRHRLLENTTSNALVVSGSSQIPQQTVGQVVSESRPAVIKWAHQYSCLSFLGSWLEEWSESGAQSPEWTEDTATDIIALFADLIANSKTQSSEEACGKRILEMASDGLSKQGDIISVIFDIFERSLQTIGTRGDLGNSLGSTMECLRFIKALLKVLPSRVWPFLGRSSFIGSDGKGGVMTAIISAMEIPAGQYPFLLNCVELVDAVIDDAASRAVLRKSPGSAGSKSTIASDWSAGIPSHAMRTILLNFTRTTVEVFNSNGNWRFNLPEQRFKINSMLARSFERVLYYAYGINDSSKVEAKITGVFSTSAAYILDMLRPQSTADLPFNPIFRLIADGLQTPPTLHLRYLTLVEDQVKSTLQLCIKLIQAAHLAELPGSLLEEQLFKATPVLIKLYASHDAYRLPVVSLLEILISSAASNADNEPPSLVGHLGAESAGLFLDVLSQLDRPLCDQSLVIAVWQLLSTFVSKRQQWLAVFILTGSSPRQTLKKESGASGLSMRSVPFLDMALEKLSHIDQEQPQVALALLEFVSRAQENWPWATPHLSKHPHFFTNIINHVSKLKISSLPMMDQIYATRIAAVVADLCAVYLHSAKEMGDRSFIKTLIPLVSWYSKDAVEVSAYNSSLHANLKKNFENRYSGCKMVDFKRTPLEARSLGRDYYYDLGMGDKLLSYDFAWAGAKNRGFAEEFERANINLSLVEAQVGLLNSWKFFAIEHCADFMPDTEIRKSMALVAQSCLRANISSGPPEAIFVRIQQARIDFAQALLQRLVEVNARGAEVFQLLEITWKALRARHLTYEDALINNDTEYFRSLLNVLFLALQFHVDSPSRSVPEAINKRAEISSDLIVVVEVVKTIVAQGFKSLTTYLHDEPDKCTPKDFAIIIAILQTALQVKNIDRVYDHIVYPIEENETARHATTLFSWADQLAVSGDPVYAELSVSILVKMSSLPKLAEHLAVEGVLVNLSTCRLTNLLTQHKSFGPFDPVPRLYAIWTGGFLPLCLNMLYGVMRTAPEVAAFINQFESRLTRAQEAFSSGHATAASSAPASKWISLSMVSEAYSLALITFILGRFRESGASAGVDAQSIQDIKWDKVQVKEDIEELLRRRPALRARIVATSEKEVEWSRQKPLDSTSGAENRLEEKVVSEMKAAIACLGGEES